jgi:hypothetical protein
MMPYRKIEPKLWDDEKIVDLGPITKLVWVYLLTGKHTSSLPGLWTITAAGIAEGLRLPVEDIERSLSDLEAIGRVEIDARLRLMRVPKSPRHNQAANAGVVKSWWNQWRDLPECALKYRHVENLRDGATTSATLTAWEMYFGVVDVAGMLEAVSQYTVRAQNDSESIANDSKNIPNPSPAIVIAPVSADRGGAGGMPGRPGPPDAIAAPARHGDASDSGGGPRGGSAVTGQPAAPPRRPDGVPAGVRVGDAAAWGRRAKQGTPPTRPQSPEAAQVYELMLSMPEIRNVATVAMAERIMVKCAGNGKPLPEILTSIRAAADRAGNRAAGDQPMAQDELIDLVCGYATKIRPRTRASPGLAGGIQPVQGQRVYEVCEDMPE